MKIAVYCGSNRGNKSIYAEAAEELGREIGKRGDDLVFGGAGAGLMGIVCNAVTTSGGKAYGVLPDIILKRAEPAPNLTECIRVKTMAERKTKMREMADSFIALPGGVGTLEEISEIMSMARLGQIHGACMLYNVKGFYDPMKELIGEMTRAGFLFEEESSRFLFPESIDDVRQILDETEEGRWSSVPGRMSVRG